MKKFLERVADYMLEEVVNDSLRTVMIFPNKRSEIFLKNFLKQKASKSLWLPEMFTIDEFMINASGLNELDPIVLSFKLFEIHKKIAGQNARTLDDFLSWAPIMLADFNDIDLYLADPEKLFSLLSEARAMHEWNVDGSPLTDIQKNYLAFYNSLYDYYTSLNEKLKSEQVGYKGLIYRYLAENIESLSSGLPWKRYIYVGFNALSRSEKKVFGYLKNNFTTDVFWDVDEYYINEQTKQDAGRFINELIEEWGIENVNWVSNHLLTDTKKNISVVGVPKRIGQVKLAGQELEELIKNYRISSDEHDELLDTAVVLADENLLMPLVNSLPVFEKKDSKSTIGYNITMGYPMTSSPFNHLINLWLDLLISQDGNRYNKYSVYYLLGLLNNPVLTLTLNNLSGNNTHIIYQQITKRNNVFLSRNDIVEIANISGKETAQLFDSIILKPVNTTEFIRSFISLMQKMKVVFAASEAKSVFLKEQLVLLMTSIKKMELLINKSGTELSFKALQKIFNQVIRRIEVNLKGEPLSGIQIMGMLETRNLDFKNIILLSANEGALPKSGNLESFIPFDIRSAYKLPLPKDKTDVYAYHFYRLMQRCENVLLIYNSESDELGGGEKSRFILQLENELGKENPNLKPHVKTFHIPLPETKTNQKIIINKTDEVLKLINNVAERGFSPTALSGFISCSLKFYFRYILGLRAPDTVDESIEADVFGSVVHAVLEEIYEPFAGGLIDTDILQKKMADVNELVIKHFKSEYVGGDLDSGKNLLIVEAAKKYIRQFLNSDIAELKVTQRKLVCTEKKLTASLAINNHHIQLKGIIDRVDMDINSGHIRIIDYKTGDVRPGELKIPDWESLVTDSKWAKAFQVLFYSLLYPSDEVNLTELDVGIISLRRMSSGFMKLVLPDNCSFNEGLEIFTDHLGEIIDDIANPEKPFVQTEDEKECSWCDFKNICNRQGKSYF